MFLNVIISSIITFQTWKKLAIPRPFVEAWTYKRTCVKTSLKVTSLYPHVSPTVVIEVKKFRGLNEAIIKPATRIEANFVGKTLFYLTEAALRRCYTK